MLKTGLTVCESVLANLVISWGLSISSPFLILTLKYGSRFLELLGNENSIYRCINKEMVLLSSISNYFSMLAKLFSGVMKEPFDSYVGGCWKLGGGKFL